MHGKYSREIADRFKGYKHYLENFLRNVISNPYLKNSEQIIEFLNSERDVFVKRIAQIDEKTQFPVR